MRAYSYHTHSRWSDGRADIAEMIAAAQGAGLAEIGLSDHYVLTPYSNTNARDWSMPLERLDDYVAEIQKLAAESAVTVRLGIEADYFAATWRDLDAILQTHPFDYVIGSVHYVGTFPVDFSASVWEPLSQDEVDAVYCGYWTAIGELAATGIYDIVGHLDLPKKFAFRPACDLSREITAALDAIAAADVAVELNTSGWDKPCADGYPSTDLVAAVHARGIPMLISADAHDPADLLRHYDRARERLTNAGVDTIVRFEGRRRIPVPLA